MPPLNLSKEQLAVYEVIQRIYMAWVVLIVLFVFFGVVLAGLLYAAFSGKGERWLQVGLAVLNGLLGTCITRVVFHLFPKRAVQKR